jgi:phytol kinase
MSASLYNSLLTIAAIIYVFGVVAIMDFAVKKGFPSDLSRKVVHIAAGSWLILWLFYDSTHWTKYLNIAPAFVWTLLLVVKGFTASENDQAVKTMTRHGDRRELIRGPLYFTLIMNLAGTFFYGTGLALTTMGFLTWGDGLAPVIGSRFGKHKFNIFSTKTVEGSISFFFFGLLGAFILNFMFAQFVSLYFLLICAVVTTIVEAASPKDLDNILIPISIGMLYFFLY